jgi:hypothetical protein
MYMFLLGCRIWGYMFQYVSFTCNVFLLNYISGTVRGCLIFVLPARYARLPWSDQSSCMYVRCPIYVVRILKFAY